MDLISLSPGQAQILLAGFSFQCQTAATRFNLEI